MTFFFSGHPGWHGFDGWDPEYLLAHRCPNIMLTFYDLGARSGKRRHERWRLKRHLQRTGK